MQTGTSRVLQRASQRAGIVKTLWRQFLQKGRIKSKSWNHQDSLEIVPANGKGKAAHWDSWETPALKDDLEGIEPHWDAWDAPEEAESSGPGRSGPVSSWTTSQQLAAQIKRKTQIMSRSSGKGEEVWPDDLEGAGASSRGSSLQAFSAREGGEHLEEESYWIDARGVKRPLRKRPPEAADANDRHLPLPRVSLGKGEPPMPEAIEDAPRRLPVFRSIAGKGQGATQLASAKHEQASESWEMEDMFSE
eukprot:TRINITY_DN3806_c1_g1_i3.p1 TRINITY_DN3806_c1_g1~~TRINITY_DN3806_c1_g1_i3.p1  ORF type:complete len:248 (+),score=51.41 TRINITY_DN3806_c1_g1_i3:239-982(+)